MSATKLAALYTEQCYYAQKRRAEVERLESRIHDIGRAILGLKRGRGRNRVRDWKTVERLVMG